MSENLIEVKNLTKLFNVSSGTLHAVDDISFEIEKGTTLGIVGESGCGKSTTGRLMLNLIEPTSGEVYFDGELITNKTRKEMNAMRTEMQLVFQDPYASLNPRRTVEQIISEPLKLHKIYKSKKELSAHVDDLMDKVKLNHNTKYNYPHEMDGGRRQRVGIARALALNPKFIVCDEPVSALDVSVQAQILNLLQDLQDEFGLTYAFITHDLSVVKHFSNVIMVMYLGQIVEITTPEKIFSKSYHPYTKALISAIPIPEYGAKQDRVIIEGEISNPIDPEPGCRFATRCPYAKDKCFSENPILEKAEEDHKVSCHFYKEINNIV